MGFGTVAASIILFIAVITVASGFVVLMNLYAQETQTSLTAQKNRLVDELKTDITIESISYYTDSNETVIYVKNTGKTDLNMNYTDIYFSGSRVERNDRTLGIEADTLISAEPLWSPKETLKMNVSRYLKGGVYTVKVVAENGVSDEDLLSVV